jgi:hypothetical protein
MLKKLKEICFSTKSKSSMDDLICDGRGWIKQNRGGV